MEIKIIKEDSILFLTINNKEDVESIVGNSNWEFI